MSGTIPPLLCSTPPPIDFDDGGGSANANDDFETFESGEDAYGRFEGSSDSTAPTHSTEQKDLELPFSDFMPFSTNSPALNSKIEITEPPERTLENPTDVAEYDQTTESTLNDEITPDNIGTEKNDKSILTNDRIGFIIHDPPPTDIGYCPEPQSAKISRDNSPLSLEFSPENLSDDDSIDFQINESRYDDNTSLPSLKFDSINISKSATPILEDKPIVNQINMIEGLSAPEKEISVSSALHTNELLKSSTEILQSAVDSPSQDTNDKGCIIHEPNWLTSDDCDLKVPIVLHEPQSSAKHEKSHAAVDTKDSAIINSTQASSIDFLADKDRLDDFETDFHPFESCSTSHEEDTNVLATMKVDNGGDEFSFEADFSQIDVPSVQAGLSVPQIEIVRENKSSDNPGIIDDDFEDFQDFKAASVASDDEYISEQHTSKEDDFSSIHAPEHEDDDFGEFNDFKENEILNTAKGKEAYSIIEQLNLDDKLKGVLEMMFPANESSLRALQDEQDSTSVLARNLSLDLQEIDSAKALEYQWLQSNIKNSLVKSLGIDTRNILYGEKWNASMPRFAANLGLGPLEPLKPTKVSYDTQSIPQATKSNSLNSLDKPSTTNSTSEVPTVKFDWNDAGLINPLDGVKEILHEGKAETIHSTKSNDTYGSSSIASVTENSITNQQTTVGIIAPLSSVDNDLKRLDETVDEQANETSNKNKPSYRSDENYSKPSTMPLTPKFIPLKETHIYTPSKSEGTIARSVNKSIEKEPIDFDYEIAAAGIVINEQVVNKEYRDVVYNPETQDKNLATFNVVLSQQENSFKRDPHDPIVDPNKGFRHKHTGPDLLSQSIMNIIEKKEESSIQAVSRFEDEFSDFQQNKPQSSIPSEPIIHHSNSAAKYSKEHITPSCIGGTRVTPTQETFEEEFTDFQSVPPPILNDTKINIASEVKRNNKIESGEMILSPAILLPQAVKIESSEPKINWPSDSNIDPEELARLEQLFPQAKQAAAHSINPNVTQCIMQVTASPKKERKDDEDWSDFISVPPPPNNMTQKSNDSSVATPTMLSTISKTYDDDDWSEYVSGVPSSLSSTIQPVTNKPWIMSPLPPPQFSSWNQPSTYNNLQSLVTPAAPLPFAAVPPHSQLQQQEPSNPRMPIITGKDVHQARLQSNNRFSLNGQMNSMNTGNLQKHTQQDMQSLHKSHYQQRFPQQMHQRISSNTNANFNVLKSQLNNAPSISLIPDLSFTAPKSLVQLSRTSTNSKK